VNVVFDVPPVSSFGGHMAAASPSTLQISTSSTLFGSTSIQVRLNFINPF